MSNPRKHQTNWSEDDDGTLARMWREGYPAGAIARALDRNEGAVHARRARLGLMPIKVAHAPRKHSKMAVNLDADLYERLRVRAREHNVTMTTYMKILLIADVSSDLTDNRPSD